MSRPRPERSAALLLAVVLMAAEPSPPPADRAYWLVGNWHCESRAGSKAARTYSRVVNDGSINMTNRTRTPSAFYVLMHERYQYDPATESWRVDSPGNVVFGAMHATATRWLGEEWIFEGRGALSNPPGRLSPDQAMRMVYTARGDDEFHRSHQIKIDQRWTIYSEETCTRDPLPRPRPTP